MENNYGMKWHKFLIYFSLWLQAVLNAVFGIMGLSTAIDPPGRYRHSHSDMVPFMAMLGIVFLVLAVLTIVARFKLAGFRSGAPKFLLIVQLVTSVATGIFMIIDVDANIMSIFSGMIVPAITYYYYTKRNELFVN